MTALIVGKDLSCVLPPSRGFTTVAVVLQYCVLSMILLGCTYSSVAPNSTENTSQIAGRTTNTVVMCQPCLYHHECGPQGACLELESQDHPNMRMCAPACRVFGDECNSAGMTGRCEYANVDNRSQRLVCVPQGSCFASQVGAFCSPELACSGRYSECVSPQPWQPPQCLAPCQRNSDCEDGYSRCASVQSGNDTTRVCIPDERITMEQCSEQHTNGSQSLLGQALEQANLTPCNLYFDEYSIDQYSRTIPRDRFRLPMFDRIHRDWSQGVQYARNLGPQLDRAAHSLSSLILATESVRSNTLEAINQHVATVSSVSSDNPLADAIAELRETFGTSREYASLVTQTDRVPMELQLSLSAIVRAMTRTAVARDTGLLAHPTTQQLEHLYTVASRSVLGAYGQRLSATDPLDVGAILGDVQLPIMEAVSLAQTIEMIDWNRFRGQQGISLEVATPLGLIVIADARDHVYRGPTYERLALLVDLGGNDTYLVPVGATTHAQHRVSVAIDLAGNDVYDYEHHPHVLDRSGIMPSDEAGRYRVEEPFSLSEVNRQGAGRLGVGFLYDFGEGNDTYRSLRGSQGFGAFGIGGLYDEAGHDSYAMEAGGQGAGMMGIGVLLDGNGNDRFEGSMATQGFGYVRGAGVLFDHHGNDEYVLQSDVVVYHSSQDRNLNSSLGQGMGLGRPGDAYEDGVFMSGGIGVLRDSDGNDQYNCGVYCQGSGYLGGMGLLLDATGNDDFQGSWYAQGSAAHYAYAALLDGDGQDTYNTHVRSVSNVLGTGHDFSLGLFIADGMNHDRYIAPNHSIGVGLANGAGIFLDQGGDDTYQLTSRLTCGHASVLVPENSERRQRRSFGLFLDGGGMDRYLQGTSSMEVGNDQVWSQREHIEIPGEIGLGADGSNRELGL